jgi:hypothetical protein
MGTPALAIPTAAARTTAVPASKLRWNGSPGLDYALAGPVLAGAAVVVFLVTLAVTQRLRDPPRAATSESERL